MMRALLIDLDGYPYFILDMSEATQTDVQSFRFWCKVNGVEASVTDGAAQRLRDSSRSESPQNRQQTRPPT